MPFHNIYNMQLLNNFWRKFKIKNFNFFFIISIKPIFNTYFTVWIKSNSYVGSVFTILFAVSLKLILMLYKH